MFCIAFTMFFFMVIFVTSKFVWDRFSSAADAIHQLAVAGHVLNQILNNNVLHTINTSKIECEKFSF